MSEEVRYSILCVDDEEDIIQSLYDIFMYKYDVRTATNGAEALEIFKEEDIALVISDQRMPKMQGSELLAHINRMKPYCKKILLTGYSDISAAKDAINQGSVDKYFDKPWNNDELLAEVENLLKNYDFDKFIVSMESDLKVMNVESRLKKSFERFLERYPSGVCVLNKDNKVEYMNNKGLDLFKCKDISAVEGKHLKDKFIISESILKDMHDRYVANDQTPVNIDINLEDKTRGSVKASVICEDSEGESISVVGILFQP